MKINNLVLFILITASSVFAQMNFSGGMGIYYTGNPNLSNYLNKHWTSPYEQASTFNSNVEFYISGGYKLNNSFELGIDYGYAIHTFSSAYRIPYEISYTVHSPTLMGYYLKKGEGYLLKLGAGLGYRNLQLEENIYFRTNYSTNGLGLTAKADANTSLGGNLYANVGVVLRFDYLGKPEFNSKVENGITPTTPLNNVESVNFTAFSAGIRLGVSYIF